MSPAELLLVAGALLAAGLAASLVAERLRLPALLLFLLLGMAIGSDGTGWIDFDDYELAQLIGTIALALILFEGGLSAGIPEIRPVLRAALGLAVIGTVLTAVIAGLGIAWLFDLPILEGLLLGSIVASTDSAAIFGLLRSSSLKRRVARTLEGETGLNDPVAVLLVLGFINWITLPDYGLADMVGLFLKQLALGTAVGATVGVLTVQALQRVQLSTVGLIPVASTSAAGIAYGVAASLDGSGFMAVYLTGLALGSSTIPAQRILAAFHQGVAWVAQIALFLTLGLLVFPSQLDDAFLEGAVLALLLAFVARPLAVLLVTVPERYSASERGLLAWAGLRGAVPVVLATFAVVAEVPDSLAFFNIVFFSVVVSTLLQGPTFEPLARALGVTSAEPAMPRPVAETATIRRLGAEVVEHSVFEGDAVVGRRVRELGLPRDALVNVIVRGEEAIPPRGSTRIDAGDRLHVLVREAAVDAVLSLVNKWRRGPLPSRRRPHPRLRARPVIFTVRRWTPEDGDPAHPERVLGAAVIDHLRTRRDHPGALVALDDGRYAITGPIVAVGSASQLQRYARDQLDPNRDNAEQAWWQEVIGVVAR